MTEQEAAMVVKGDVIVFEGQAYLVHSIKTTGIAAPYFRLATGMTSYRLCSVYAEFCQAVMCGNC